MINSIALIQKLKKYNWWARVISSPVTVRKDVSVQSGDIHKDYNLNKKLFHIAIT